MAVWEYRVVPAPRRGIKIKGAKTTEDRFAAALSEVMNDLGAEGWEYVRSDTLPVEERQGLTGRTTVYHNMLVFRRARMDQAATPVTTTPTAPAVALMAPTAPPVAIASEAGSVPPVLRPVPSPAAPAVGPAVGPAGDTPRKTD